MKRRSSPAPVAPHAEQLVDDDALETGAPLYARLAGQIREQILSGRFTSGQRLPTEEALGREGGVSRLTVRHALALLQRDGLIVKRQGLGSFVTPTRVRQVLARLETLDASIAEQGMVPSVRVLDYSFAAASQAAREALLLPKDGSVLFVRRVHHVGGEPIAHVEMSVPAEIGEHFSRRDVDEHTLYELLPSRLNLEIGSASQYLRAGAASPEVAENLHISPGSPVLLCERVTYAADRRPLIYTVFTYRADRFEFRVTLSGREKTVAWAAPGVVRPNGVDTLSPTGRDAR